VQNRFVRIHTAAGLTGILFLSFLPALHAQSDGAVRMADPESAAVSRPIFVPMTQGQRFQKYLLNIVSLPAFIGAAASAGYGQWLDHPKEWGEGDNAYAKRYASAFAGHTVRETLKYGVSAALHEDNRYIRSGRTGFRARVAYAVESTFLARHDDGTRGFSISAMTGFVGAAAISRTWQPYSSSHFLNGANAFGTSIGVAAGFNVAREFLFNRR
jgi:hypothetical protein